jgi:glycine cleavage system H protein
MTVLFVALTIALFFAVDWLVHRGKVDPALVPADAHAAPVRLPRGVFFARSHTWLNLFPSGCAWLGIDDFVTRLLDQPQVRYLKSPGARVNRGEPLLELVDGEHSLTVRSPLDGVLLATNASLARHPDLLKRAPFCEGWTCEIKPDRHADVKALLLGDETAGWMQEEFRRLRDVFAGANEAVSPAMLQDGGPPIAGAMKHVAPEVWTRFDREFLEVR